MVLIVFVIIVIKIYPARTISICGLKKKKKKRMSRRREPAWGEYKNEFEAFAKRNRRPETCHLIGPNEEEYLIAELKNNQIAKFLENLSKLEEVGQKMTIKKGGPGEYLSRMHAHAGYGPSIADNLLCFVHQLAEEYAKCHAGRGGT